jgi:SET domain-containing protein
MPSKLTATSPRLLVRSSSIHAAGCYTLDAIPSGRRILEYSGPLVTKEVANERYADRVVTYLFGFSDGSKNVIDGFGTAMFINHCCDPNCDTEEKNGRIFVRAIRDIAAGEELVYEYNLYDSDEDNADCYCGVPQCRGTMYSDDELKRRARRAARLKSLAAKKKPATSH